MLEDFSLVQTTEVAFFDLSGATCLGTCYIHVANLAMLNHRGITLAGSSTFYLSVTDRHALSSGFVVPEGGRLTVVLYLRDHSADAYVLLSEVDVRGHLRLNLSPSPGAAADEQTRVRLVYSPSETAACSSCSPRIFIFLVLR